MNINELREKWHRDAEQAHDWHGAAWDLMRELDDARTECARAVAGYNDLARRVDDLAGQLAAERRVLADSRRREESLRLELGATKASLNFALETNKRLKAERDAADTSLAALLNNGGDDGARVRILEARLKSVVAELELVRDTGNYVWAVNRALRIARGKP